jgi:hypothetical protein
MINICVTIKEISHKSVTYVHFLVPFASNKPGIPSKVHFSAAWISSTADLLLLSLLLVILFPFVKKSLSTDSV